MSKITEKAREALRVHKAELRRRVDGADLSDAVDLAGKLAAIRKDSWTDLNSGMGIGGRDKRTSAKVTWGGLLMTEHQAEATVAGNSMARRIVELLPYEATRKGIEFKNLDDDARKVRDDMDRLNWREMFFTGWCWGRQFGGGGILMVTDEPDDMLDKPLDLSRVNYLDNLVVFNRHELVAWSQDIETNLHSPGFRRPRHYRLNVASGGIRVPINQKIHNSRIIRFDGLPLGPLLTIRNQYWGDSVFSGLMEPMGDFDRSASGVAQVLADFRFIVHKMPDIADMVSKGEYKKVLARVQAAAASRNLTGTMLADKEEDITATSETFAGVPEILDVMANRFASHTEYPKIVLFNQSPDGGLGSKGTSEMDIWNATVEARQTTYLAPKLDQLLAVLLACKRGPLGGRVPEDWDYDFVPLQPEGAKAKADREFIEAQSDDLRLQQGAQDIVDVMKRRYPDKLKGQDEKALRAAIEKEKSKQMELQLAQAQAQPKPQDPPQPEPPKKKPQDPAAGA